LLANLGVNALYRQPIVFLKKTGLRRSFKLFILRLVPIFMIFSLSSCGGYQYLSDTFSRPIVLKCPEYLVPAEAASLSKFRDSSSYDLVDVKYKVNINNVQLGCISNIDRKTKLGSMEVDVNLTFSSELGPANPDHKIQFEYFISIVSPDQKILEKKTIPLAINFPGNKTNVNFFSKPVYVTLQIKTEKPVSYYRIFVGLKLTKDEVRHNRKRIMNQR
jgi:hypothetical protein